MQFSCRTTGQNKIARLLLVVALLGMLNPAAHADNDPSTIKALLQRRSDVQLQIQNTQRQLQQIDLDRKDKLEELAELSRAHASVDPKSSFSKDIENEIASQKTNLHRIDEQRSDCLEELDGLYRNLTQLNRDIATSK